MRERNSSMHFSRSLYLKQLAENGYLFQNSCTPEKEPAYSKDYRYNIKAEYITDDYGSKQLMLPHSSCNNFLINYHENARKRPVDLTYLDSERILKSGRIPENTVLFGNSIGEKGIAYMLPEDYIPSMQ